MRFSRDLCSWGLLRRCMQGMSVLKILSASIKENSPASSLRHTSLRYPILTTYPSAGRYSMQDFLPQIPTTPSHCPFFPKSTCTKLSCTQHRRLRNARRVNSLTSRLWKTGGFIVQTTPIQNGWLRTEPGGLLSRASKGGWMHRSCLFQGKQRACLEFGCLGRQSFGFFSS